MIEKYQQKTQFFVYKDHLTTKVQEGKLKKIIHFGKKSCTNTPFHKRLPNPSTTLIFWYLRRYDARETPKIHAEKIAK